jgi:hypothetical protein
MMTIEEAQCRAVKIVMASRIAMAIPLGWAVPVVMDRLRFYRDSLPWFERPDTKDGTHVTVIIGKSGKPVVLCPVNKVNNLPEGLPLEVQLTLPGCAQPVGVPTVILRDGRFCLCPLDS